MVDVPAGYEACADRGSVVSLLSAITKPLVGLGAISLALGALGEVLRNQSLALAGELGTIAFGALALAWLAPRKRGAARAVIAWLAAAFGLVCGFWVLSAAKFDGAEAVATAVGLCAYGALFAAVLTVLKARRRVINLDSAIDALIGGAAVATVYLTIQLKAIAPVQPEVMSSPVGQAFTLLTLCIVTLAILSNSGQTRSSRPGPVLGVAVAMVPILDIAALLEQTGVVAETYFEFLTAAVVLAAVLAVNDPHFDAIVDAPKTDHTFVSTARVVNLGLALTAGPALTLYQIRLGQITAIWPVIATMAVISPLTLLRFQRLLSHQADLSRRAQALRGLSTALMTCESGAEVAFCLRGYLSGYLPGFAVSPIGRFGPEPDGDQSAATFVSKHFEARLADAGHAEEFRNFVEDALRQADTTTDAAEARAVAVRSRSEQRFARLASQSADVLIEMSHSGHIRFISPGVTRMLGVEPATVTGTSYRDVIHADDLPVADRLLSEIVATGSGMAELRCVTTTGTTWLEVTGRLTGDREVGPVVLNARGIDDRKAIEAMLRYRASHDDLTGLGNRHLLVERLERLLADPKTRTRTAVLFIDLDNFKDVNDTLGHEFGDKMLQVLARRLRSAVPPDALAIRFGGDEFAVVCTLDNPDAAAEGLGSAILTQLGGSVTINAHTVPSSVSIGVAVAQADCVDPHELLRHADSAMYQAKTAGRRRIESYDPRLSTDAADRLMVREGLGRAIQSDELCSWYQPVFDLRTRRIVAAEALVRWQHPERGLLLPGQFVPLVEASAIGNELGSWVLNDVVRQISHWEHSEPDLLAEHFSISVNVSPFQLDEPGFVDDVLGTLDRWDVAPDRLSVEITERALILDGDAANRRFDQLRRHGIRVAIDDFGTGHSSLGTIHRVQFDVLKVDRSFVTDLGTESAGATPVVQAILDLADQLKVARVIAEGIETEAEIAALVSLGCEYGQGFLFAQPAPVSEFARLLRVDAALRTRVGSDA